MSRSIFSACSARSTLCARLEPSGSFNCTMKVARSCGTMKSLPSVLDAPTEPPTMASVMSAVFHGLTSVHFKSRA